MILVIKNFSFIFKDFFWKEVKSNKHIWCKPLHFFQFLKASLIINVVVNWCEKKELRDVTFYCFWKNHVSTALGIYKAKYPERNIKIISKAHGYDVYEERHTPSYIPYYQTGLNNLDFCATISKHGENYIKSKFEIEDNRIGTYYMGVKKQETLNNGSEDGVFRILSCSNLISVKQIPLLAKALSSLSKIHATKKIHWTHIGDGPEKDMCLNSLRAKSNNLTYHFTGSIPNEAVKMFYQNNSVDCFINVSKSEGIPVSIMEAQSFGVPCMAPAICGIPEIVNDENGYLVAPQAKEDEIVMVLAKALIDNKELQIKRMKSYENWKEKCDSDVNIKNFSELLKGI